MKRTYQPKIVVPKAQLPKARVTTGALDIPAGPALRLLRRAMELVAEGHGGSLDRMYSDCLGNKHPCWLAIRTENFRRGLGVQIEADGQVTFVFDAASVLEGSAQNLMGQARFILDSGDEARELCNDIARTYATLAAQNAMQSLGLRVETRAEGSEAVEVVGRDELGRRRVLSVSPTGEVELDLDGFQGEGCVQAEADLRGRLADYGLQLEVTQHRRKDPDNRARFRPRTDVRVGGG